MIGRTLAHYRVTAAIGKGGMGEVYRATDTRLGRDVALKVLPPEVAGSSERLERFRREARALAALDHPGIVAIHSVEEAEGVHFLTMQLVPGQPLHRRIPDDGLALDALLDVACAIAEALAFAHERGVVHRDLKPHNVMVGDDGRVKVLDFGLAKMTDPQAAAVDSALSTEVATRAGVAVGTVPYMSPEQLQGRAVDARTDVFSLGVMLYELATGRRPFQGGSTAELVSSILRDTPRPLSDVRRELPTGLGRIVERCLAKDPAERLASARELLGELDGLRRESMAVGATRAGATAPAGSAAAPPSSTGSVPGRPLVRAALLAVVLLLVSWLGYASWQGSRARWARHEALPRVAALAEERRFAEAFPLAERAERYVAGDPVLDKLWAEIAVTAAVESEPPGARVEIRRYASLEEEWRRLGETPLQGVRLAKDAYRWRFSRPGFETVERAAQAGGGTLRVQLPPAGSVPEGMVLVPKGAEALMVAAFGLPREVDLEDYLVMRHEVTNRAFKAFVDAGGYRRAELWRHAFVDAGRELAWDAAMARFRDKAGQPGPATWEVGAYPKDQDEWPVSGVSWYEAAAYCEFAGMSLPTLSHWYRAAGVHAGPYLLPLANFDYKGPRAVGASGAMSPTGAYDMAGNVKEWAWNATRDGSRYSVGGGFGEPEYMFGSPELRSPFDRAPENGIRCVRYSGDGRPDARSAAVFERAARDYRLEAPVPDATFAVFARLHQYPQSPLDARVEKRLESELAVVERVSFAAAYAGERMPAYLWLPKGVEPPFQTLVLFPGSESLRPAGPDVLEQPDRYDFLVRSGRAVVHPVYHGMYERFVPRPSEPLGWRERQLRWSQDVRRTLEYLRDRPDLDRERIGFFGASMGAWFAPVPLAVEPGLSLAVLVGGGLPAASWPPEIDTLNYLPRVKQPLLLLCGRYDYFFPLEASQKPFFERLGTPPEKKRHVVVDSGHSVPRDQYLREVLAFLDGSFGPSR